MILSEQLAQDVLICLRNRFIPGHQLSQWYQLAGVFGVSWNYCMSSENVKRRGYGCCAQSLSLTQLFVAPWTVVCQAPLFMEFFRQQYWSGLPFPFQGIFPTEGSIMSSTLQARFFTIWATNEFGSSFMAYTQTLKLLCHLTHTRSVWQPATPPSCLGSGPGACASYPPTPVALCEPKGVLNSRLQLKKKKLLCHLGKLVI